MVVFMLKIDLTGQRFGHLVALKDAGRTSDGKVKWLCRCDCGAHTTVQSRNLKSGNTLACGCLNGKTARHAHARRGLLSPTFHTWTNMIQRCTNPNTISYKNYGARGITVCKRWLKFENFLADMGDRPVGKTLDRIDNDRGYFLTNCRWATWSEQMKNKR